MKKYNFENIVCEEFENKLNDFNNDDYIVVFCDISYSCNDVKSLSWSCYTVTDPNDLKIILDNMNQYVLSMLVSDFKKIDWSELLLSYY